MENPIKMDDLGVPLFLETPIYQLVNAGFLNHQQYQVAVLKLPNGLEHRIKVPVDVEQKTKWGNDIYLSKDPWDWYIFSIDSP